jgi:CDP-glycerol glycerophosphotransferase
LESIPIKAIDLPENTGHAHARNTGLKEVESPYFIFIDIQSEPMDRRN